MTTEVQLQIIQLIVIIVGAVAVWMNTRNRRTDAGTAVVVANAAALAADTKQAEAFTAQSIENHNERRFLQEQVTVLRESVAAGLATNTALQGRLDRLQVKADSSEEKVRNNETQMSELNKARSADQAIIAEMKAEIRDLNKTIVTLTDENKDLKTRFNDLFERFIIVQANVAATPPTPAIPLTIAENQAPETNSGVTAAESSTP